MYYIFFNGHMIYCEISFKFITPMLSNVFRDNLSGKSCNQTFCKKKKRFQNIDTLIFQSFVNGYN